jgi:hypothetical protein
VDAAAVGSVPPEVDVPPPRGLHSSTFQHNLSHFWHKIQPQHTLISPTIPKHPLNNS